MNYFLFVFLIKIYFFTSLLLLYFAFGKVKKFKVILKAKSAMRKLVRMCLAQSGYGSGLLPLVYYRQNKCILNSISIVFSLKYIFPVLFFYLSTNLRQYFSFYLSKIFRQYFYYYLSKILVSILTST